ncbi:hypothetical protein GCM10010145_38160 [Streptomyces ruber]|uniref:Uncharacterized protein n=2 Tax=Streptomyces TaxID=1883 RepID=A0A918EU10_9ACTN|nr:hypothetical protein GCM10010145_38160 [Streptomyces ruber]
MREHLHRLPVHLGQQPVREHPIGRALGGDPAAVQCRHPVRVRRRESQVVQDDDHRVPGARPFPAHPQHQLLVAQVQRGGRLVEQQQRRPLGRHPGRRGPGPLAAAERGEVRPDGVGRLVRYGHSAS